MANSKTPRRAHAPVARIEPVRTTHHGIERTDNYAWLRAENWRDVMRDPAVLARDIRDYLAAENAYAEHLLADTRALQDRLFEEMKGRIKQDDSTVPAADGPFEYFISYEPGAEHPRYCRKARGESHEHVLIDGNALAQGHDYFKLGAISHSRDHRLCAYSTDRKGAELYTIRVRDLRSGRDLGDALEDTSGSVEWANDAKSFFYVRLDENHRPSSVYRHRLGTPAREDTLIYDEPDTGFFVSLSRTRSGRFIIVNAHDHQTSEIRLIDADAPGAAPFVVAPREPAHEYDVDHRGDHLIIRTNRDGAEDFKLVKAPLASPGPRHWRELVEHRAGRTILTHFVLGGRIVRLEREDGLPRVVILGADGDETAIAFEEECYQIGLSPGYEYDTDIVRFTYSSPTTPAEVYDYDMATGERVLRKRQDVPSGHDPADYVTRRIFAPAHDGEDIPLTLLWRRDTLIDGSAPLLLYGYGAYGLAMPAAFSTSVLSLVDRGFIYAIAHIRGGKDKGYRWYAEGRGANKINTFRDFVSAGEYLARENYTQRGRIVAQGGSAGGMVMGAAANMAPDLFCAIIAEVPFVDVLNTMLDDTLPLTPAEWPEWGNPIADKAAFEAIAAYSPYDNVANRPYPHMLVLAGLTDPRVTYWEPAKWVAKLRAHKTDDTLLALKTNMKAGHAGASGRFDRLHDVALAYAFALKVCGGD